MSAIVPSPEQFQQLAASPDPGPVVMINLLKFKAQAEGEAGSGADAYDRYREGAVKMVEELGGRVLWAGRTEQILIGDPRESWDLALLVEYPSRRAFIDMVNSPAYQEIHAHREHGLERTTLIVCTSTLDGTAADKH